LEAYGPIAVDFVDCKKPSIITKIPVLIPTPTQPQSKKRFVVGVHSNFSNRTEEIKGKFGVTEAFTYTDAADIQVDSLQGAALYLCLANKDPTQYNKLKAVLGDVPTQFFQQETLKNDYCLTHVKN